MADELEELGVTEAQVLMIEDDLFQQAALTAVLRVMESQHPSICIKLTTAETGAEGLEACRNKGFDLILLDYKLPGGDGDTVLPLIRERVGHVPAIVMLSGSAQESSMQRCWLELGADSYRLKPIAPPVVHELLLYALQKRRYLNKRRRQASPSPTDGGAMEEGQKPAKRGGNTALRSPSEEREAIAATEAVQEQDVSAPGILSLLANGRRGPVRLGFTGGLPCAIKVILMRHVRGEPPPPHPHVNSVIKRLVTGEQCVEMRELCDGGELFDEIMESCDGPPPPDEAMCYLVQMAEAIAHCHAHGAVHGQLHAENVLLLESSALQLTGFSCVLPIGTSTGTESSRDFPGGVGNGCLNGSGRGGGGPLADGSGMVELRPCHPLDAPELQGRAWVHAAELQPCDIWSLGVLLVYLLTGQPKSTLPALRPDACETTLNSLPQAVRGLALHGSRLHESVATGMGAAGVGVAAGATGAEGGSDGGARSSPMVSRVAMALRELAAAMLQCEPRERPSADEVLDRLRRFALAEAVGMNHGVSAERTLPRDDYDADAESACGSFSSFTEMHMQRAAVAESSMAGGL
jgi:CheY-like chemotaxis protein